MALLTKKGNYIKISNLGKFVAYKNQEEREKQKLAKSNNEIAEMYIDKLDSLFSDEEYTYSSLTQREEMDSTKAAWVEEYNKYLDDVYNGHKGSYPLMHEIYPQVEDTIATIIEEGSFYTDKEAKGGYEEAKERLIWGETRDV